MNSLKFNIILNYKKYFFIKNILKKYLYWSHWYLSILKYINSEDNIIIMLFFNQKFIKDINFEDKKIQKLKENKIIFKKKKIFFDLKKKIYLSYKKTKKIKLIIRLRRKNLFLTMLNTAGDVIIKTNIGSCGFKKRVKFTGFALQNTTRIFAEKLLIILQKEWKKNLNIIWTKYNILKKQVSFFYKKKKFIWFYFIKNKKKKIQQKIKKNLKKKKYAYKKIFLTKYYNRFEYDKKKNVRFLAWAFLTYMGDKRWRKRNKNGIFFFKKLIKKIFKKSDIEEHMLDTKIFNLNNLHILYWEKKKKDIKKKKQEEKIRKYINVEKKILKKKFIKKNIYTIKKFSLKLKKKSKIKIRKKYIYYLCTDDYIEDYLESFRREAWAIYEKLIEKLWTIKKIEAEKKSFFVWMLNFFQEILERKELKKQKNFFFKKKKKYRWIKFLNKKYKKKQLKIWKKKKNIKKKKKMYFTKKNIYRKKNKNINIKKNKKNKLKIYFTKKKKKFNFTLNWGKKENLKINYLLNFTKKKEILLNYNFYRNYSLYYTNYSNFFEEKFLKKFLFLDLILKNNLKFWSFRFIFKGFRKLKYNYKIMNIKNKRPLVQSKGFRLKKKRRL